MVNEILRMINAQQKNFKLQFIVEFEDNFDNQDEIIEFLNSNHIIELGI